MIITLQIITTTLVLIWFDWLKIHNYIAEKQGYKKWTKKSERKDKFFHQLFACYFCTSFWLGLVVAVLSPLILWQLFGWSWIYLFYSGLLVCSNLIVSRLLDHLLGYQSFKS